MLNERMVVPDIRVYKNNYYFKILPKSNIKIKKQRKLDKVLVFDLDETLGSFHQLVILWNLLDVNKNQNTFNILLDLYPEFMREGILKILKYIIKKKKKGECDKLYIYTNSVYSPEIPNLLTKYFQYKLKEETIIFDKVISAFKINNKIIETGRTTNNKTHDDFIQCALYLWLVNGSNRLRRPIYLLHLPLHQLVFKLNYFWTSGLVILVSMLTFYFIEQPFIKLGKKFR
jgi:hypothetical protein